MSGLEYKTMQAEGQTATSQSRFSWLKDQGKKYLVDTAAGATFFTGAYIGIEILAGMSREEIIASRTASAVSYGFVIRPVTAIRDKIREYAGVTDDSPRYIRWPLDSLIVGLGNLVIYNATMSAAGVSFEERKIASAFGFGTAIILAPVFAGWLRRFRNLAGTNPESNSKSNKSHL